MAISLKDILTKIKQNTLDKTNLDERVASFATNAYNSVKNAFSPAPMLSPLASNAPNRPTTWNTPQTYTQTVNQPQNINTTIPSYQPLPRPSVKSEPALKLQSRLDSIKKFGSSTLGKIYDNEGVVRGGRFTPFAPIDDKIKSTVGNFINKNTILANPESNNGDNFWSNRGANMKPIGFKDFTPKAMLDDLTSNVQKTNPMFQNIVDSRDSINQYIDDQPRAKWLGENIVKPTTNTALTLLDQANQIGTNFSDAYNDVFNNEDGDKNVLRNSARMLRASAGAYSIPRVIIADILNANSKTNFSKALTAGYANTVTGTTQSNNDGGDGIDAVIGRFIGGIAGWKKNPINEAGAEVFNKFIPYKDIINPETGEIIKSAWEPIKNKFVNYIVTRGGRGMAEDLIDNISRLEDDKTDGQNTVSFIKNELIGALSEIVSEKAMDIGDRLYNGRPDVKDTGFKNTKTGQFFGNQYVKVANAYNNKIDEILGTNGKLPEGEFVPNPTNPNNQIRADALDPETGLPRARDNSQYNQMWGMTAGVEPYQDENGEWKVRINPQKAALGMILSSGSKTNAGKQALGEILDNFRLPNGKPSKPEAISDILANKKIEDILGRTKNIDRFSGDDARPISKPYSRPLPQEPDIGELRVSDRNAEDILHSQKPVSEILQPKPEQPKVEQPKVKPIKTQIDEFATIHPAKKDVFGKTAETAYKNLETGGHDLADQITNGLKTMKVSEADFVKFVENPDIAPAEIRPAVDAHRKLMETLYGVRENKNLGKIENYFPRMTDEGLTKSNDLQKLGNDLWVSDYTKELGTSKKRTGNLTNYSDKYNAVMKNYISQTAYDKYGKRIGMDQKTADFSAKVDEHLTTDEDGLYSNPNSDFDYVGESSIKNEVKTKTPVFAKVEPIDTFDSLRRKINLEDNGKPLSQSMVNVRDVSDKIKGILLNLEDADTNGKIDILAKNLINVGEKTDIKKLLNEATNGGKKELTQKQITTLLKAEKDFTIQKFVDEVGKYKFGKETQKYLNEEIDRMIKSTRYENTFWDKLTNAITGTFYRAQIWGNVNTGIAQKMESVRIPVLYSPDVIAKGTKRGIADLKSGDDVLKRYDFSTLETNVSKQLNASKQKSVLKDLDEKAGKVGNFFVNVGENSKNRDFLLTAEAQGEKMGLEGQELKDFVRNELFANGFILHEFGTPKMLKNPLVRLGLQYQQYNLKLINRMIELGSQKQLGKVAGLAGSQVLSAGLMLGITGKIGTSSSAKQIYQAIKDRVVPGFGPIVSITDQIIGLVKDQKESGDDKTPQLTKLVERNTIPFANQYFKTSDAKKVLDQGYDLSQKGNIKYPAGDPNFVQKSQALLFGKSSLPNYRENSERWNAFNSGDSSVFPVLTSNQTAVMKALPKDQQEAYYEKQMENSKSNEDYIADRLAEDESGKSSKRTIAEILTGKEKVPEVSPTDQNMTSADKAKQNSRTKAMLDAGLVDKVTDDELNTYFFGTINALPSDTTSEKYKKTSDLYKKLDSINSSETLDDATKERLIGMAGIPKEELEYYNQAKDDATTKALRQEEKLSGMKRADWFNELAEGRRLVGNKQIVDNTTLNELYERGVLSDAERDYLKAIKFDPVTDDYYMDRDYKGSGGGLTKAQKKSIIAKIGSLNDAIYSSSKKLRDSLSGQTKKSTPISDYLKSGTTSSSTAQITPSKSLTALLRKKVTPISSSQGKVRVRSKY